MTGHGGHRPGSGRKRLIDIQLSLWIGSWCENRKRELREEIHRQRQKSGSVLWRESEAKRERTKARLKDPIDPLDRAASAPLLEQAGHETFGNKTLWRKSPRWFRGNAKPNLSRSWSEELEAGETVIQTVYRECREHFASILCKEAGPDFELTDRRIKACEDEYKAFLKWESRSQD